jgi:outer membrane protein assembly factor BamB
MATLAGSTLSPASAQEGSSTWPMLQGGPGHLGQAAVAIAPPLKQVWRARPEGDARVGAIAVVPGLAVSVAATQVIAVDPADGRVLWTVPRAGGPVAAPAIDPSAGTGGLLVMTEGASAPKTVLVAIDLVSRSRLWTLPLGDIARGSPTIEDGRVYVGSRNGFVYAADVVTGTLAWKVRTAGSVDATPAVDGGKVFVVSESETVGDVTLAALDAATGRSRWRFEQPRPALGPTSPSVFGGSVYVGFGDDVVRAFDQNTGAERWSRLVRAPFSFRTAPAIAGGSVYLLDEAGGIYRLDAGTGETRWEFRFPSRASWSAPLVAGSTVYVGLDDGFIAGIDIESAHLVWRGIVPGQVGALAPSGDLLLASTASGPGGLLAFGSDPSGQLLDEPSPTELDPGAALVNYAGAFLVLTIVLVLLFRFVFKLSPNDRPGRGEEETEA